MELKVEQGCPQCGAPVTLAETDRLLTCPYCGVRNFLRTSGPFRYILPAKVEPEQRCHLLHVPYLRFKSNVYSVSESGIAWRVVDTTHSGHPLPGLPPTLGMRPQAMKLARVTPRTEGSFLGLTVKTSTVQEKAALLSRMTGDVGQHLFHRAYIGDTLSLLYLPLRRDDTGLVDAINDQPLVELAPEGPKLPAGTGFHPRWQVSFLPTLCPRCGAGLDGEGDCLVLTCRNCDSAWEINETGLARVPWRLEQGGQEGDIHLAFWQLTAGVEALNIESFADFLARTNQPMVARPQWHERPMSFWIPAFKLRPKNFLQIARQVTISQWRLDPGEGRVVPGLYPVTLPRSEARQAVKITLAASAASPGAIYPYLPEARISAATAVLVFLPFVDRNHDWVQPQTGAVIAKSILRFGRSL